MPLPSELTVANWKKVGLPLRSTSEKIKQTKTGVSEALRGLAKADKALFNDILSADKCKAISAEFSKLKKAIEGLKAKDNKKLQAHCKKMLAAANKYIKDYNAILNKLNRKNIGSVPGAMKSLRAKAEKEFSTENLDFYSEGVKATTWEKQKALYEKFVKGNFVNIPNKSTWDELFGGGYEKKRKDAISASMKAIISNMDDTLGRVKNSCNIKF